jgi:HlyD family secretion protein
MYKIRICLKGRLRPMANQTGFFKRKKRLLIVLAVIAVIAVIVLVNLQAQREKSVRVTLEKVERQDLTSTISASGEIKPKKNVNISAQVPGRIINIGVEEGEEIKAGAFLLQLDSTQYEANADRDRAMIRSMNAELIQAEARHARDKNIYERQSKLFDEELISKDQLEGAKAQFDVSAAQLNAIHSQISQAEASLKSTLDNLSKTTYVSPIDGIVTSLQVEEGEVAIIGTMNNPGTVLLTIADLSVMEVEVEVDETDVVEVRIGQEANVRVDAYPDVIFKGRVTEVGSSALQKLTGGVSTQESKDFKVVITLEDPPYRLKPGLSASADIITAEIEDALVVPISALVLRETEEPDPNRPNAKKEEEGVYVTESGRAKFQPVEKGIMGGMMLEIKSGLQENQEIISGPYAALRELKEGVLVKADEAKDTE